jgi:PAS domain S-box-containing protein
MGVTRISTVEEAAASNAPDYQRLFEASPRLLVVLTPDLTVVSGSDAYCAAMGLERDTLVGRYLFEIFPDNPSVEGESTSDKFRASFLRVLQYRRPDVIPVERHDIPRPDCEGGGFEERYWSTVSTPVLSASGEVDWIIVCAEDVTERVRMQAEGAALVENARSQQQLIDQLKNTTEYLDALIEHLPGLVFIKSCPDFRYLAINRATEALIERSRDEVLGKTIFDFYPAEQAESAAALDRAVIADGAGQMTTEECMSMPTSGLRWLKTTKVAVRDAEGAPKYLLGFSQDITEQKAVEQQLRQAVKMEAVGQLTGGIAHDFNNLLSIVIGNLDFVIESEHAETESLTALREALEAALRGSELTRRLLVFSRNKPLKAVVFDLNRGLAQNAAMVRRLLGGQIDVEVWEGRNLWLTCTDPAQLDEAILNLAINARDAMPKGGTIQIATENVHINAAVAAQNAGLKSGDYVLLTIKDTGTGMSPETLERCFEPFFTTKSAEKGTGLGLSMVYGFVKQSGGYIKLDSALGRGTTIKIYLPRSLDDESDAIGPMTATEALKAKNELILVVEDEPDLRKTTLRQLAELGYRTLEAEDADNALRVLAAHPEVDLVFTDVMMPGGMTGLDLARHVRAHYPTLKVLLTSGYAGRPRDATAENEPLPDLLNKPFRKHELAARLRSALGRG